MGRDIGGDACLSTVSDQWLSTVTPSCPSPLAGEGTDEGEGHGRAVRQSFSWSVRCAAPRWRWPIAKAQHGAACEGSA
jgi:hypothetical protein